MEDVYTQALLFIKQSGWLAPFFFIILHLLRQFLFVPVIFICIVGGYLFGAFYGTLYSIIGLTLTSIMFYLFVNRFPIWLSKLTNLKTKYFGEELTLTTGQISILRLIPFMHFHLLSFCIIEITSNLKEYTWRSFVTTIPLALMYTSFGHLLGRVNVYWVVGFMVSLVTLFYLFRKKSVYIKWNTFFSTDSSVKKNERTCLIMNKE